MAKPVIVRGDIEWINPKEKYLNGVKWIDNPKGKYSRISHFKYNWLERILIRLRLLKPKLNTKYLICIDPFK